VRIYQGGGHCRARERVLDVAGRLFREKGFDGIDIDDLMKGAGLKHGAFTRTSSLKKS
jgi:AcrR family transcriptional regulator